jgi:hypothetical protein
MLLILNRLMETNFGFHVGYVSIPPRNQPIQTDVGYPAGYVSLILRALVQNETLFCDSSPPTVPYTCSLNGYSPAARQHWTTLPPLPKQRGGPGKVVQIDESCFSSRKIIAADYAPQPRSLWVSSGNRGGLYLQRSLIDPPRHRSP